MEWQTRLLGMGRLLLFVFLAAGTAVADDHVIQRHIRDLKSEDAIVRMKAAKALGMIEPAAKAAIPALEKALNDPDEDVRLVAARALKNVRQEAAEGPVPGQAGPDVRDLEVTATRSLFSKPYRDPIGVASKPAQRFFLVQLKNNATEPVAVEALKVTWRDRGRDLSTEVVEVASDPIVPGLTTWFWFTLRCDDQYYGWTIRAERVAARSLDAARQQRLRRDDQLRGRMALLRVNPIRSFSTVMGHEFTVSNPTEEPARRVRIAILGHDAADKLVELQILHADRLPTGQLRIVWCMSRPEEWQKATSFFTLEEIVSADRLVNVERYTGEILDVGVNKKKGY